MTLDQFHDIADVLIIVLGGMCLAFLIGLLLFFGIGMLWDMWVGGPDARARWAEARKAVAAGWIPPKRRRKKKND